MIQKLKDWWLLILAAIIGALDAGFDAVNPLLVGAGLDSKIVDVVKYLFMLWGFYKAIKSTTQSNKNKIEQEVINTYADDGDIGGGGIKNPPPAGS